MENYGKRPKPLGRWIIDHSLCTGCGDCIEACPLLLLKFENKKVVIKDPTGCNQCGKCYNVCGSRAISLT